MRGRVGGIAAESGKVSKGKPRGNAVFSVHSVKGGIESRFSL